MKFLSTVALLAASFGQLSLTSPIRVERSVAATNPPGNPYSGIVKILHSYNHKYVGWYAFVDPRNDRNGSNAIPVQFAPHRANATGIQYSSSNIFGGFIFGYSQFYALVGNSSNGTEARDTLMLGSTSVTGTPDYSLTGGSQLDTNKGGAFTLFNLPRGTFNFDNQRNYTQLCFPEGLSLATPDLPTLVLAHTPYKNCSNVTLAYYPK